MKRSILFLISLLCTAGLLWAHMSVHEAASQVCAAGEMESSGDQVHIVVDSLLVANYNKLISKNMKASGIPGYRIRIYSESGIGAKKEQQQVRARFLSLYPGIDAYNRYDEPYFKIFVGDCRTRSEALKLLDMIEKNFPNSFIRDDYINLKSVD